MKRILFIDDEPRVLENLQEALRLQRTRWDMSFALGGAAGRAAVEQYAFDVVVTDLGMPHVDGATLLAHVKALRPNAMRIILSGPADSETAARAASVAHQFLNKPCSAETLRLAVERACRLQQIVSHDAIRAIVGKLEHLPSPPETYWSLTKAAGCPESSIGDFAAIVERDPAMSMKVLQLVNSPYFGLGQTVTSLHQAVVRLGVEFLKALALSVHTLSTLKAPPIAEFSLEALQRHSLLTARVSKWFFEDPKLRAEVFTASMVHDVGKLVLAVSVPQCYREIVERKRLTRHRHDVIERDILGISHAEVGAYLLSHWGLPLTMVEAVAFHHSPGRVPREAADIVAAVHIADALVDASIEDGKISVESTKLDLDFIDTMGLRDRLTEWCERAAAVLQSS